MHHTVTYTAKPGETSRALRDLCEWAGDHNWANLENTINETWLRLHDQPPAARTEAIEGLCTSVAFFWGVSGRPITALAAYCRLRFQQLNRQT